MRGQKFLDNVCWSLVCWCSGKPNKSGVTKETESTSSKMNWCCGERLSIYKNPTLHDTDTGVGENPNATALDFDLTNEGRY